MKKPEIVGYLRASRDGKPEWSEDCICADPVYPNYDGDESISMAVVRLSDAQELAAENERLLAALCAPDQITAEPAGEYDPLRKQFMSLRMLANSSARMCSYLRQERQLETREALLTNADQLAAERDTNARLTNALEETEAQRDQLAERIKQLESRLAESEANDRIGYGYLSEVRAIVGGDDFPAMIERVRELANASNKEVSTN